VASEARSHTSKNQPNVIMPIAMLYHMMACTMNKVDFLCNSRLLVRRACALCSTASACKVDENDKFRSFLGQSAPADEKARVENDCQ
jgi:hypothetical protein